MTQQSYRLIVIEKEKVPLAADLNTANGNFWLTLAVMLAIVVLILLWYYLMRCRDYRRRIRDLDPGRGSYRGWNLKRLKRMVKELELAAAKADQFF